MHILLSWIANFLVSSAVFVLTVRAQTCPSGFMGKSCDKPCRDFYRSCEQWQTPEKCTELREQTDFFDVNCAKTCGLCQFDEATLGTDLPLAPILQPLAFLIGQWESSYSLPIRYPTDHYEQFYHEFIDFAPAEVIMFGSPSINYTSISRSLTDPEDVRYMRGYVSIKQDSEPPEVSIMSTSNEGLNTVELGRVEEGILVVNMTYMQIHPSLDLDVLPIGGSRLFKRDGPNLEMSVIKLDRRQRIGQFTKFFRRLREYRIA